MTTPEGMTPAQRRQRLHLLVVLFCPAVILLASSVLPDTTWGTVARLLLILAGGITAGCYLGLQRRNAAAAAKRRRDEKRLDALEPLAPTHEGTQR